VDSKRKIVLLDNYYNFENAKVFFKFVFKRKNVKGFSILSRFSKFQHQLNILLTFFLTSNRIFIPDVAKNTLDQLYVFSSEDIYKSTFFLGPIKGGFNCLQQQLRGILLIAQFKIFILENWSLRILKKKFSFISFFYFFFFKFNIQFFIFTKFPLRLGKVKLFDVSSKKRKQYLFKRYCFKKLQFIKKKKLNFFFSYNNNLSGTFAYFKREIFTFIFFIAILSFFDELLKFYQFHFFERNSNDLFIFLSSWMVFLQNKTIF